MTPVKGLGRPRVLSIVVPVYENEMNLPETVPTLLAFGNSLEEMTFELVFVDDGSRDASLQQLLEFQRRSPGTIKVVKLTRNFGSMAAIHAGLGVATGDCVAMIAADLQDPPELLLDMVGHWKHGTKAVFAVRADRNDAASQKLFAHIYYALMRQFALAEYPTGGFDFFLIDRQVVDDILRVHEKNTNLMSLIFWLGYRPALIPYVRQRREKGVSRWTFMKRVKLFIDSFVAFSYVPIRALSIIGLIFATSSFVYGAWIFLSWLRSDIPIRGYAPIAIVLTFTAGIQMTMLGILGEYLWRTLDETRRRPPFVIDELYGVAPSDPSNSPGDGWRAARAVPSTTSSSRADLAS